MGSLRALLPRFRTVCYKPAPFGAGVSSAPLLSPIQRCGFLRMGKPPFSMLLTCAGRKVSLVNQFRQAFEDLDLDGRIIGVDSSSHSAVLNVCDKSYIIPRCDHPAYVPTLLDVCRRHRVQLLLPLIDVDLLVLAEHRDRFREGGTLAL